MPGWPLPTFCTASMASTRTVSTAFWSRSDQSSFCWVLTTDSAPSTSDFQVRQRAGRAGRQLASRVVAVAGRRGRAYVTRPCPAWPGAFDRRIRWGCPDRRRRNDRRTEDRPARPTDTDESPERGASDGRRLTSADRWRQAARASARQRHAARTCAAGGRRLRRADQAAHHRAAAGHHRADDAPGRGRRAVAGGWSRPRWSAGALAAGSANTLNCYLDRDIDQVMHRTERRPLATGLVSPREALVFGVVLGVVSVAWLPCTTGWLAGRARVRRDRVLRRGLHDGAQARARRRTSCGAARPAACRCSSAGRRSPGR